MISAFAELWRFSYIRHIIATDDLPSMRQRKGNDQMKIDKKTLSMLSALPDDKLWQMLSVIASASGIRLPSDRPDETTMVGIRNAVSEISDGDISRATEIFTKYKEGKKNG